MELHHSKHHQTYVTNLNNALKSYSSAISSNDIAGQIALQAAIKFNGGGHINHSLFWENLTPASSAEANPDSAPTLMAEISRTWGNLDGFKSAMTKTLLGLQGSGWGWLVRDSQGLRIVTTKDQDPVVGGEIPIFGIDMWEHAYYLQVSEMPSVTTHCWLTDLVCLVSEWQGGLHREYLECDQLEDCRGPFHWNSGGCFQGPSSFHLSPSRRRQESMNNDTLE